LRDRDVARPFILTYSIHNLDLPEKYELSVVGHELWHLTGTSATGPKRELLLNALRDEMSQSPSRESVEEFNRSYALLWEALAYDAQLRLESTSVELAEQIQITIESDKALADLVSSVRQLTNLVIPFVKQSSVPSVDLVIGYLHECMDLLGRLNVPPEDIKTAFKSCPNTFATRLSDLEKSSWTALTFDSILSSLPESVRRSGRIFKLVDVSDPRNVREFSLSRVRSGFNHDFFIQNLRFHEALLELVAIDTSELLAKYVGAMLDEFGVTSPVVYRTVDSLETAVPRVIRTHVQNPPCESTFRRLGEHIRLGQTYATKWKIRLERAQLMQESRRHIDFLRSLYRFSDDLVCPDNRDIENYRCALYSKLRKMIVSYVRLDRSSSKSTYNSFTMTGLCANSERDLR
jgi:hypothetical protein